VVGFIERNRWGLSIGRRSLVRMALMLHAPEGWWRRMAKGLRTQASEQESAPAPQQEAPVGHQSAGGH